jgi:vacuolar-type H+-ATPase subunit H
MSRNHLAHAEAGAPVGDLAQLVAMEQGLEQRLARAREEAHALLDTASREAAELARSFDDSLTAIRAERQRQLEQEKKEGESRIMAEGRRRAEWYDRLPEATEQELAGYVLDRLLGRAPP